MAGILGEVLPGFVSGEVTKFISSDLNELTEAIYDPTIYDPTDAIPLWSVYDTYRIAGSNTWGRIGDVQNSFFQDYYFRIHVDPIELDLQTVASSQTREVVVWNAWPYTSANLNEILISNPVGVEITGQAAPYLMAPLLELTYEITIGVSGPPNIDIEIQYDFSNVSNPLPIHIIGTRAIKFDIAPEVPVSETWEWLTDNIVATDGTEQRIALRGEVPRTETRIKVIFDNLDELNIFYSTIISANGRLWLPEYQYATRATAESLANELTIYFDETQTDIRDGEYILIQTPLNSALVEIDVVSSGSATVSSPLTFDIPVGSIIVPGSPALLLDKQSLNRYSVNDVAEIQLTSRFIRQRTQMQRPGSVASLTTFLTYPVLDKRPLADDLVSDRVSTGQKDIDNKTGLLDIITRWDYSRVGGPRNFKVDRIKAPEDMDYWKAFFAYCRGESRRFWVPTYREDLVITVPPSDATTTYTVKGKEYAEKVFGIPTHQYLEIETAAGIHRTQVLGASVLGEDTIILLATALPTGSEWQDVKRISYLLPCRLDGDKVDWSHYGLESLLNFSIRTAEV